MKALVKVKRGAGNIALMDVKEPVPLDKELKVQVKAVGVCGTDLHIYHGTFPYYNTPVVLGHEFSGVVIDKGADVTKFQIGDRVVVLGSAAIICGECKYCRSGNFIFCPGRKGMGHGVNGAMSEFVTVREDICYLVPSDVSFEEASLVEPLSCCLQAVEYLTPIHSGDFCLVSGPGSIGLLCLLLLRKRNITTVLLGLAKDEFRLNLGKKIGADCTAKADEEDVMQVIEENFMKDSFDVCFECSGFSDSLTKCIDLVAKMGSVIQVGIFNSLTTLDFNKVILKQLKIFGSLGFNFEIWQKSYELITSKKLDLKPIITHKFKLEDWEKAFQIAASPISGKVIITI